MMLGLRFSKYKWLKEFNQLSVWPTNGPLTSDHKRFAPNTAEAAEGLNGRAKGPAFRRLVREDQYINKMPESGN